MSATQKKCDMKRVQHKVTREKLQHEKSARVKYAKKKCTRVVHQGAQMDNGSSVDGPLYTGHNRPNKPTFKDGESEEK